MKIHSLLFLILPCLTLAVVHRSHMSTENGFRGTAELSTNKTATDTDTDTSLPGLSEYFGAAYDIFTGNPVSNTIDPGFKPKNLFKWSSTLKTTQDQKFTYPEDITVKELQSCSRIAESEMYTGLKGYHESLEQNVDAEAGYDGIVASVSFTASVGYKTAQTEISTQNKVRVTTQEKCLLYEAGIPSKPTLSEDFKNAVEIARVTDGWTQFLKDWGTHYAKQLVLGASAIRETIFDKTTVQNLQAVGVDVEVGVSGSYGSYHGSVSSSTKLTTEQQTYFEQAKSTFREFYIGVEPTDGSTASQWALKLQGVTPLPITFSLGYIGDVIYTKGIDYFGGKYSTSELESMKNAFNAAVTKLANTLTPVPSNDPALPSVTILTAHTLTYGGYGGGEFEDREILNNPLMRLQAIEINCGTKVDGIKFKLNDGVRDQWTDWHGGSGGSKYTLNIPSGRRVAKVEIWSGDEVNGLRFIYDDDTYSSVYGRTADNYNVVTIYGYLTGMKGRSGTRLDAVAFISNEYSYDPTNPKSVIYATPRYGGSGGGAFQDYQPANTAAQPSSLDVRWSKDGVKGIRLVLKEGSSTYGNNYGSTSDTLSSLSLGGLKTINVWSGSRVDAIQVVTSSGTSAKVGGSGGGLRTINVPAGATLIGLYGRTGSAVDAIGFVFAKRG